VAFWTGNAFHSDLMKLTISIIIYVVSIFFSRGVSHYSSLLGDSVWFHQFLIVSILGRCSSPIAIIRLHLFSCCSRVYWTYCTAHTYFILFECILRAVLLWLDINSQLAATCLLAFVRVPIPSNYLLCVCINAWKIFVCAYEQGHLIINILHGNMRCIILREIM